MEAVAAQLNPTPQHLGASIKKMCRSKAAHEILDKGPGGTWTAGGCALLAAALSQAGLGLLAVLEGAGHGSSMSQVQHWPVQIPGGYIDADGFSTGAELLRRWKNEELISDACLRAPKPADFRHSTWLPAKDAGLVQELVALVKISIRS